MPELDTATVAQLTASDASGMLKLLTEAPARAELHWQRGQQHPWPVKAVKQVLVCGMGGSGSTGDLLVSLCPDSQVAIQVNKAETLPAWVNTETLVIGVSYSGQTRETLACLEQAQQQGAQLLTLSSGGRLAELAATHGWHHVVLNGGLPPRAALFDMLSALLGCLSHWEVLKLPADTGERLLATLKNWTAAWLLQVDAPEPLPLTLAQSLLRRLTWFWGLQGQTGLLAARWKNQLAENAKVLSVVSVLPELNHNEIVPMCARYHSEIALLPLTLDPDLSAGDRLSVELTREHVADVHVVAAQGETRLERVVYLTCLGDFVSVYLAFLQDCDPTPIAAIDELKRRAALLSV